MLVRAVGGVLGLAAALVVAVAGLYLGPTTQVTCDSSHGPAAVAEEAFQGLGRGHVDGASSSTCPVPSAASWVLAGLALPAGIGAGLVVFRPRPGPVARPSTVRR